MPDRCFFFGCWNEPGHFLRGAQGTDQRLSYEISEKIVTFGPDRIHLDGSLAPRRMRYANALTWSGSLKTRDARSRIDYDSSECPQGEFLRHVLDNGFTAIAWWDRTQGDKRGACNSTILLEGVHTSEEMLVALKTYFPHVLANLEKAGVALVELKP